MKPITVLIPICSGNLFLQDAINSVLCQTFSDNEIFILDDGVANNSPAIILSYTDPRVKYISSPQDIISALNKGIELSAGKYIALLNHDDMMMPYRLQIQYDFMEANPEIAACGGYSLSFGPYSKEEKAPLDHQEIMQAMLLNNPIPNSTGFVRRKALMDNHIKYEQCYSYAAHYKLWSEIAKTGKLANIPKILTLYRAYDPPKNIEFRDRSFEEAQTIKWDILDYFLSHIKKGNEIANALERDFIPAINELGEMCDFSSDTFFRFMHELVGSLIKKGLIIF